MLCVQSLSNIVVWFINLLINNINIILYVENSAQIMAQKHPRRYKNYLRSCNIEDVSPRIKKRLKYNSVMQAYSLVSNY